MILIKIIFYFLRGVILLWLPKWTLFKKISNYKCWMSDCRTVFSNGISLPFFPPLLLFTLLSSFLFLSFFFSLFIHFPFLLFSFLETYWSRRSSLLCCRVKTSVESFIKWHRVSLRRYPSLIQRLRHFESMEFYLNNFVNI